MTTNQDLKDAAARYNTWAHDTATIYKTPGGWYHLTSADFTHIVSAPTRETLENAISAYIEGIHRGRELEQKRAADTAQRLTETAADIGRILEQNRDRNDQKFYTCKARLTPGDQEPRQLLQLMTDPRTAAIIARYLAAALQERVTITADGNPNPLHFTPASCGE